MRIQSPQNPRIKEVSRLVASRRHRDRNRLTVVEGLREIRRCIEGGWPAREAYACEARLGPQGRELLGRLEGAGVPVVWVSAEAYARIAYREESGGIVLVVPYADTALARLGPPDPAFLVVVEGAEKPGNVGAILRTADAAGVHGLVLCGEGTDLHNPNVIRASLGTRFTVPCAEAPTPEVVAWLRARGVRPVAATPEARAIYTEADLTGPVAVVMGSEAHGLSPLWRNEADLTVRIPMFGAADSLNLATATALLLYEVVRQRGSGPAARR